MNGTDTEKNRRILVIDDNPSIHDDLRKILCRPVAVNSDLAASKAILFGNAAEEPPLLDFKIDSAYQGQEGLAMARAAAESGWPYAMAFIDIRMPPGWDGIETISQLWKNYNDLQVVICTAYSDYTWEEAVRKLGRSASLLVLKKPFDNIEVLQMADALTEKWALNDQLRRRMDGLDRLVKERTAELERANEELKKEIAEQAKLESQLRQAQKMEAIGQLAAGVAHDFNNILTVIGGNASLLLMDKPADDGDRTALLHVCAAADRATKLVRQLLMFSRKQPAHMTRVSARDVLAGVNEMLPRLLNATIAVRVSVPVALPSINADAGMMEQLFMNLAINARDAMPDGGTLSFHAETVVIEPSAIEAGTQRRAGSFICVSVTDTGCGIAAENLLRIFEPFFTTKPIGKGTGLGLSTVFGIVKLHGGWVDVESTVGKGTTFKVYIPVCESTAPLPAPELAPDMAMQGGNETILLAEDHEDLRCFVTELLKSCGYRVLAAPSGAAALDLWRAHQGQIDLLLTDMVMPEGVSGRALAEQLRAKDPNLKVIISSGYSPGIACKDISDLEGGDFLAKPFQPVKLLQLIRRHLDEGEPAASAAV